MSLFLTYLDSEDQRPPPSIIEPNPMTVLHLSHLQYKIYILIQLMTQLFALKTLQKVLLLVTGLKS